MDDHDLTNTVLDKEPAPIPQRGQQSSEAVAEVDTDGQPHVAFQVICLGSGGGPSEDNVTGLLVRAVDESNEWKPGSVLALDAGSHLAPITRIMEKSFPSESASRPEEVNGGINGHVETEASANVEPGEQTLETGPFAGLATPHTSARANARYVLHKHIAAYLITHPHLDHLSAFAINTAGFPPPNREAGIRPKVVAGTVGTVDAIKRHIFNDVIWPNLTDEDGGVGFVTFKRLREGGGRSSLDVPFSLPRENSQTSVPDEDDEKTYVELVEGISAKGLKCSHGVRSGKTPHDLRHRGSVVGLPPPSTVREVAKEEHRRRSLGGHHHHHNHHQKSLDSEPTTPGEPSAATPKPNGVHSTSPTLPLHQHFPHFAQQVYNQGAPQLPSPGLISPTNKHLHIEPGSPPPVTPAVAAAAAHSCVVDSTAFFLRTTAPPHKELLFFGDVEPDSLSLYPRNHLIWREAAKKFVKGALSGVIIECSFADSVSDEVLFGHLCPRHLVAELQNLAGFVVEERAKMSAEEKVRGSVGREDSSGSRSERSLKRKRSVLLTNGSSARRSRTTNVEHAANAVAGEEDEVEEKKLRSRSLAERTRGRDDGAGRRGSLPDGAHAVQPHDHHRSHHHGVFWANGNGRKGGEDSTAISPRSSSLAKPPAPTSAATSAPPLDEVTQKLNDSGSAAHAVQPPTVTSAEETSTAPLEGLKILIIHIKDTLQDGPRVSHTISRQLHEHEQRLRDEGDGKGLGCDFIISEIGEGYWF